MRPIRISLPESGRIMDLLFSSSIRIETERGDSKITRRRNLFLTENMVSSCYRNHISDATGFCGERHRLRSRFEKQEEWTGFTGFFRRYRMRDWRHILQLLKNPVNPVHFPTTKSGSIGTFY
jgi:hypothetical protein